MKHHASFLALPFLFTLTNLFLALLFKGRSTSVRADDVADLLVPAQHEVGIFENFPALQENWDETELLQSIESLDVQKVLQDENCLVDLQGGIVNSECTHDGPSTSPIMSPTILIADSDSSNHLHAMPPPYENFEAYVQPSISSFYQEEDGSRYRAIPSHLGMAGKFINMTPEKLNMYWESNDGNGIFMGVAGPFASYGTGTFAGHKFYFTPISNPRHKLCQFVVKRYISVHYCDPFSASSSNDFEGIATKAAISQPDYRQHTELSPQDRENYDALLENLSFGKKYKTFTGREWLSQYPRNKPRNAMWEAEYFGQQHYVQTKQTQFVELPPEDMLSRGGASEIPLQLSKSNETSGVTLQQYRTNNTFLNLTLTAMSCAPRVFEIPNFLSEIEVDHLIALATQKELPRSTTGMGESTRSTDTTRTSRNTWVGREASPVVDAIYRRAADVLGLDEALLRRRSANEHPDLSNKESLAEQLQLVHYDEGEEYTAHHDFGYPTSPLGDHRSRWANILLYLNDPDEGGETSFPRWANGHTTDALDVKPRKGHAALFYMLLPDGNLDDLSQHAALPVRKGEKWLANMWIWDPIREL